MACWALCKPESEFYQIFGDHLVPIRSLVPIIPREEGSPPCYVVLIEELELFQANALAEMLFQRWYPECKTLDQAKQYIMDGLPLKTSHFNGCGSDDFFMMPWGTALNAAIHFDYAERHNKNQN